MSFFMNVGSAAVSWVFLLKSSFKSETRASVLLMPLMIERTV